MDPTDDTTSDDVASEADERDVDELSEEALDQAPEPAAGGDFYPTEIPRFHGAHGIVRGSGWWRFFRRARSVKS